jgi:hypothetical protein
LADSIFPVLKRLQGENVKILFMATRRSEGWDLGELESVAEVKVRDEMFGGGVIVDGKEAILFLGGEKSNLVIWSSHIGLVQFAKDYFQYLWNSSEKPVFPRQGFSGEPAHKR